MTKWTNEELYALANMLNEEGGAALSSTALAVRLEALKLGPTRTASAVQKKTKWLRALPEANTMSRYKKLLADYEATEQEPAPPAMATNPPHSRLVVRDRADFQAHKLYDAINYRDMVEQIAALEAHLPERPAPVLEGDTALIIHLSDLHCGEKTPFFNKEVFKRYFAELPYKIRDEVLKGRNVDTIVFALNGDIVEGEEIYKTQAHHIDAPTVEQLEIATRSIWGALVTTQALLPDVELRVETCYGNHGRQSHTANEKTNWDNAVYSTLGLIAHFSDADINVRVSHEQFTLFEVAGKKVLMNHHGTKHIATATPQAKHLQWRRMFGHDIFLHGHWHNLRWGNVGDVLVNSNGAWPGNNMLSDRMAVTEPARQAFIFVERDKPITEYGAIYW